ncbi:MAG: ankyrin repeat domain-containing protein [Holophagales bacterium]|nr:ankyrin repeat domain-containing protein [Holophagales bacterium]
MSEEQTRCLECELSGACSDEDLERVEQLLALGADPSDTRDCNTALHDVLERRNPRLTRLLLEHGADPNRTVSTSSKVPLLVAIESGQPELSKLLLEHGARPDLVSWWDIVAPGDFPELVRAALDARMDPNRPDPNHGTTALHLAAMYGYIDCLDLLLRVGADPARHDANGSLPLDLAIRNNHLETARRLQQRSDK